MKEKAKKAAAAAAGGDGEDTPGKKKGKVEEKKKPTSKLAQKLKEEQVFSQLPTAYASDRVSVCLRPPAYISGCQRLSAAHQLIPVVVSVGQRPSAGTRSY